MFVKVLQQWKYFFPFVQTLSAPSFPSEEPLKNPCQALSLRQNFMDLNIASMKIIAKITRLARMQLCFICNLTRPLARGETWFSPKNLTIQVELLQKS
jgi:hypothetical protein